MFSLLRHLGESYGDWFESEVIDDHEKRLREGVLVTVNGIASGQIGGLEAKLKEGDIVTILPFFAGGG